eukprot:TRINITY_DN5559_c0_g1_i1.p1 TRINITY_DN5559_c0_g1~~TRINITY_DN5559_c0_g1_i1.p1  ORF type:complete len:423 (+),score=163.65 TRINITY_DN5559_c0_g1_i1:202-1470(+)
MVPLPKATADAIARAEARTAANNGEDDGLPDPAALVSQRSMSEDGSTSEFRLMISESVARDTRRHAGGDKVDRSEIPKKLVDRHGRVWHRSTTSLGAGTFGNVWLGMAHDGSFVAIKTIPLPSAPMVPAGNEAVRGSLRRQSQKKQILRHNESLQRHIDQLVKEVNILKHFNHESIVNYLACIVTNGHAVLVLEYVSGGTLETVMAQFTSLPSPAVRRYSRDILSGLTCLHSHNIVHRDLKPANLLMTPSGQCKLADFGAAKRLSKMESEIIGTPLYMSPEACRGVVHPASDVWSLGIVVCQMLTGDVPYTFTEEQPYIPHSFMFRLGSSDDFGPSLPDDVSCAIFDEDASLFLEACFIRNTEQRPGAADLEGYKFVSKTEVIRRAPSMRNKAIPAIGGLGGRVAAQALLGKQVPSPTAKKG